ncbi:MAG: hypothetical protein SF051_03725 [Elusimicrobiota bacterium]|nr:hypothetical protein [Elusimicrobiota bacterium]
MVENLEHLIRRAATHPLASRAALFKELLRSETYLLTLDEPLAHGEVRRVTKPDASFPVWADKDPELGGIWVPLFPARDRVRDFVGARGLKAPRGKEFLWMGHMPGQVFSLLRGVRRFAGVKLFLDPNTAVSVPWAEVRALAEGSPVADAARYELPLDRLVIPAGAKLSFGRLAPWAGEEKPVLLFMPEAGRFTPEDARRLVRLPLSEGRHAWTPCRHFLQILARLKRLGADGHMESVVASLIAFEMYGEAEALCEWLAERGRQAFAWLALASVYGRSGRMDECAELCAEGAARYPAERGFHVSGVRALLALGRREEAARRAADALARFPGDAALAEMAKESAAPAAPAA